MLFLVTLEGCRTIGLMARLNIGVVETAPSEIGLMAVMVGSGLRVLCTTLVLQMGLSRLRFRVVNACWSALTLNGGFHWEEDSDTANH